MLCDFFQKVLYISLSDDADRHLNIENEFKNSVLHNCLTRFDAVNGKNIDIRLIDEKIVTSDGIQDIVDGKIKRFGITLTYGALGCALSHYLIYQDCIKNEKPYLIFEDDITLIPDFDQMMISLVDEIKTLDYDIIYLGLHNLPSLIKNKKISKLLYKPEGLTCGTFGMIVSHKGAKKILNNIFPISTQIDSSISNKKRLLNVYATNNQFVKHNYNFGSHIQTIKGFKNNIRNMI